MIIENFILVLFGLGLVGFLGVLSLLIYLNNKHMQEIERFYNDDEYVVEVIRELTI